MYDYCFWKGKSSTPVKSDNFCFSSNPKQPKRPVVLVWLRSDRENIPIKTSRVLFNIFLICNAEEKIVLGEYGEPPLKNIPLSIFFIKIRKILMPSKSFNENSENKTSLSRRTFVVGSGVEPLAHCFHTDALPMLSHPNN